MKIDQFLNKVVFIIGASLVASFFYWPYLDLNLTFTPAFSGEMASKSKNSEEVLFVGDVLLARDVERSIDRYRPDPFSEVKNEFKDFRYVFGNFEASIPSKHLPTKDFNTVFSVRADLVPLLSQAGFTHFTLANNHSLDHGTAGFENTKKVLSDNGLISFGEQGTTSVKKSITVIELNGQSIAVVAINFFDQTYSDTEIQNLFENISKTTDFQVAYVHWGTEYKVTHSISQERLAHLMIDAGADAVIGHHPHVVQDIGSYNDKPIFYSLGNFLFDQYFSPEVMTGLTVVLQVDQGGLLFTSKPVSSRQEKLKPRFISE